MESGGNIIYSDKFTTFIIQVANQPLTGPNRLMLKNLRIGPRIRPSGTIPIITELLSNKTKPGWLLTRLAIRSSFVRSRNNKMTLLRYLPTMSKACITWGLTLSKSARTVSSGIFQVPQTSTTASSILSRPWVIMVSCHLYRSVLSSGSGSEISFCSSLKTLESATFNRSWNSLGSMIRRVLIIAPALVITRFTSAFKPSSILGIEMFWIAVPASGWRLKVLRLWYSATSLYMRSGTNNGFMSLTGGPAFNFCKIQRCWVVVYGDKFWTSSFKASTHYPVRSLGELPLGLIQVQWRKKGKKRAETLMVVMDGAVWGVLQYARL